MIELVALVPEWIVRTNIRNVSWRNIHFLIFVKFNFSGRWKLLSSLSELPWSFTPQVATRDWLKSEVSYNLMEIVCHTCKVWELRNNTKIVRSFFILNWFFYLSNLFENWVCLDFRKMNKWTREITVLLSSPVLVAVTILQLVSSLS